MSKIATFTRGFGHYYPANKDAIAACAILSKMVLSPDDMVTIRSKGYETRMINGEPIGRVDIKA